MSDESKINVAKFVYKGVGYDKLPLILEEFSNHKPLDSKALEDPIINSGVKRVRNWLRHDNEPNFVLTDGRIRDILGNIFTEAKEITDQRQKNRFNINNHLEFSIDQKGTEYLSQNNPSIHEKFNTYIFLPDVFAGYTNQIVKSNLESLKEVYFPNNAEVKWTRDIIEMSSPDFYARVAPNGTNGKRYFVGLFEFSNSARETLNERREEFAQGLKAYLK